MGNFFIEKGYNLNKDLFIESYDWRLAVKGLENEFYPKLKKKIEESVKINNQKGILLGYSLGGHVIHYFITHYCNESWVKEFLNTTIFLAPAIAGASQTLTSLWYGEFSNLNLPYSDLSAKTVWTMPSIHILSPNHYYYENEEIILGPNNKNYTAKDVPQLLKEYTNMSLYDNNLHDFTQFIVSNKLKHPGLKTLIIYNSAIQTQYILNKTNSWNSENIIYSEGDGTVPSKPLEKLCKDWKNIFETYCEDLINDKESFNHGGIGINPQIFERLLNFLK